jgi:hypothetical protein
MNMSKTETREYLFSDLAFDVWSLHNPPVRLSVIKTVILSIVFCDDVEPEESPVYVDCKIRGFQCRQNGEIDKRSTDRNYIRFPDSIKEREFELVLARQTNDQELIGYVSGELEKTKLRKKQELDKILQK